MRDSRRRRLPDRTSGLVEAVRVAGIMCIVDPVEAVRVAGIMCTVEAVEAVVVAGIVCVVH